MVDYLDDVVGQDIAKKFIRTAIKKGNLYNFLLVGPRGVGKRSFGFALAKTLDCPPNSPDFHLITPIPSKIEDKSDKIYEYSKKYLPDNIVVDTEDRVSILIQQIRNLDERFVHMPGTGRKRVVLILDADYMTDPAANCFLKTLEEPPIDTVFILTSSRPEYLLPTIRSRCQLVRFVHLSREQITRVVYEGRDDFLLGSPGEVLALRESGIVDDVIDIFRKTPMNTKSAAGITLRCGKKNIDVVDLYYPLLLLYRLVFYRKLNISSNSRYENDVTRKAKSLSLNDVIDTIALLNQNIFILDSNPNKLLHLFNALLRLP